MTRTFRTADLTRAEQTYPSIAPLDGEVVGVGMSTADGRWVYERSRRGDVVEVTGTDRQLDLYNGWGGWNASYAEYRADSAL